MILAYTGVWNQSIWNEHGIHVESMWNPGGFHVNIYVIYVIKHIPYGIHVEWVESIWNISIPYGFHMECGGMVKYWASAPVATEGDTPVTTENDVPELMEVNVRLQYHRVY